ncbi:MAG: imidazoleglycerol-phosphate dehydratase HisB [Zymomonas mobilis subsp. pomaceae]|uniref:Imidazoleglycerol-phosphate dehydratase n=1 Tax=Zymomonas mobilis subsp. pomaceae (strain ATCC 29192 / DSM 22645 / JCM 10191 / CCUG 17912 / NBRC 13757 / NCIMB 11200 / NRRL B-4491 / Barker I) TaxID=579138 RepID=F8EW72_ZYMMT|nr:imidazoleglycerol-phosphate dehydratase HisB [Zymomonas mobilis]AEI38482.1 Imidazoleglycerol-phosphate dehydratase [Zymomonas mobilis subsp. pomaceae ATCC 29192]MDX5948171.1 imidazoleglycerol-phosphate dehydratase HisB [Zymomonas mobilis subsp. pomaceae]
MQRIASIHRQTAETDVLIHLNLEGTGQYNVKTGIGFLDHMLEQLFRHSLIDCDLTVKGDLHIDPHHTTEDSAIALGQAVNQALGDKRGITRFSHAYAPMDESLSRIAIDISGRPYLVWRSAFTQPRLGDLDTEMIEHWFLSFAQGAGITLHVETLYGHNNHHIAESLFKGLALALRQAVAIDPRKKDQIPSTKESL